MGKRYRLSWRTFEGPVKAIIHFYCSHPGITEAEMSAASFSAWCAVDHAMDQLNQEERDIIMERFSEGDGWMDGRPSIELVNAVIRKMCRLTAEGMGIADKEMPTIREAERQQKLNDSESRKGLIQCPL